MYACSAASSGCEAKDRVPLSVWVDVWGERILGDAGQWTAPDRRLPRHAGTMTGSRPSIALVLGAGGVVGAAWHAGVLAALEDIGWDARSADLVVGTSAGSGMAAALRLGIPPSDLLAGPLGEPMSDIGQAYAAKAGPPIDIPSPQIGGRIPRPQAPHLTLRAFAQPWRLRPFVAMSGLLPEGRISTRFVGDRIRKTHEQTWPDRPTWICTVRLSDGRRVIWGREHLDGDLATAVEASSAIPGFFEPVAFGGDRYVDGGAHSPTNVDAVAGLAYDLVVVSSPMSATTAAIRRPKWSGARALHARTLAAEVEAVRASGTPVLVFQPGPEVVDAAGANAMDMERRADVARLTHDTVCAHLASDAIADRRAILTG